ncbi:hypothetical protein VTI74DRAFT_10216 [Chaetomium olivicolor]
MNERDHAPIVEAATRREAEAAVHSVGTGSDPADEEAAHDLDGDTGTRVLASFKLCFEDIDEPLEKTDREAFTQRTLTALAIKFVGLTMRVKADADADAGVRMADEILTRTLRLGEKEWIPS